MACFTAIRTFLWLGGGFVFFLFKENQSLVTFRKTNSFSVSNLCMRLEQFPPDGLPCPGGKMLPLACDGCCWEKERKNQHTANKTTVLTSGGEWRWVYGQSDGWQMWSIWHCHPLSVEQWDAPLHGMPGQGVCWSITLAAAQQQGTLPVPPFLHKFYTWKYISISRNKTRNRS